MKSIIWKTAIAVMVLMCWATTAYAKEVTLIFATTNMPNTHLNVQVMHPWAKRINEQGKGVIKIDVRDGFTLANHMNYYDRALANVVQITWGVIGVLAGKFPRTTVVELPFISDKSEHASVAFWRLIKSGLLDAEYDQIVPLFVVGFPQRGVHTAKPLKSLDDLNGIKMTAGSRIGAGVVTQLGGTPISLPLPSYYEGVQRGTVDGVVGQWTMFQPFKLAEVTKYHVDTQLGGSSGVVFMTKKTYNALPAAARKIIDANSGEAQTRLFGAFWDRVHDEGRRMVKAMKDHTIVNLTPEQAANWRKRLAPVTAEWIKDTPDGEKVLAKYTELLEQVKAGN